MNKHHDVWTEKFRPNTIEDCILPSKLREIFQGIVNSGTIPNLLLFGSPGTGKTTVAKALCKELDCDYIFLNGSLGGEESGIEAFRTKVRQFASTVSFFDKKKVVIIDEADYLNPNSAQPALRGLIEEFAGNCSFIFTANNKSRIIEPIHSRCCVIEFRVSKEDKPTVFLAFVKRLLHILKNENVEVEDKKVVGEYATKYYPDFRRSIHELQKYVIAYGKVDVGILSRNDTDANMSELIKILKSKDYMAARKWVVDAMSDDPRRIFRKVYDAFSDKMKNHSIAALGILVNEFDYKSAFVTDHEINLLAFLTEIMMDENMEFI